ncbi:hypothetical protein ANANG_G00163180 [Anguilla anguilla]|uniref:Uncharacterized protein n=1 Tax=Anguilla anguilla TaxID=7936 RepID=A0A9D3M8L5_ANGAN|nr:hypothetical protein ANANG_G00163180 [Anguilla anguilla]
MGFLFHSPYRRRSREQFRNAPHYSKGKRKSNTSEVTILALLLGFASQQSAIAESNQTERRSQENTTPF